MRTLAALMVAATALSGCSAKWNTAYRTKTIGEVSAITIDAKQRHVLMQPEHQQAGGARQAGDLYVRMRMCAEPAPDVFAAIAASGSALIEVDAKSQTGAGQVGIAAAETAASIERTQTINLLRESFFRTCERYLSGAISSDSFTVQAGRDARAMVAVLAIEQLTGAIRRPSTIISGPATQAQAQAAGELGRLYAQEWVKADTLRSELTPLEAAEKAACGSPKKESCDADKAAVALKKAELGAAEKRLAELNSALQASGANSAAAGTSSGSTNSGGSDYRPDAAVMAAVAATVQAITMSITQQDDMRLFCIQRLHQIRLDAVLPPDTLPGRCMALLTVSAQAERRDLEAVLEKMGKTDTARRRQEANRQLRELMASKISSITPDQYANTISRYRTNWGVPNLCMAGGGTLQAQANCVSTIESGGLDSPDPERVIDAINQTEGS